MSDTEVHVGKLQKVELNGRTIEEFMKMTLKSAMKWKDEYEDDIRDAFTDEYYDTYFIVGDQVWEIIEHQAPNPYDNINEYKMNEDGTVSFISKFYNGGTCLSEMVEEGLEKLLKDEEHK